MPAVSNVACPNVYSKPNGAQVKHQCTHCLLCHTRSCAAVPALPYMLASAKVMQHAHPHCKHDSLKTRAFFSRLSQKLAISSALLLPATCLLQNDSNASLSALWNSELLLKHSATYCAPTRMLKRHYTYQSSSKAIARVRKGGCSSERRAEIGLRLAARHFVELPRAWVDSTDAAQTGVSRERSEQGPCRWC